MCDSTAQCVLCLMAARDCGGKTGVTSGLSLLLLLLATGPLAMTGAHVCLAFCVDG